MSWRRLLATALLALPAGAVRAAPALPAPPPADAVILWNGRDIDGWTVFLQDRAVDPKTVWSVTDGVLQFRGQPYGYLRTKRTFSNYKIHAEWRYPEGSPPTANSGLFIHVHGADNIWPNGIECQLRSTEAGLLIATNIDMPSAPMINKKKRAKPIGPMAEKPFGQWNSYDIFCRGDSVEVYVNGVLENHVEHITYSTGSIALQMEGARIQFRNVWLEPLQ